jgi:quercetin dioxygenase-like cupin family protein
MTVGEGDMFVIPPGVSHNIEAVAEPTIICFMGPLREDYAPKTGYQAEFERFDHEPEPE